jgi:hypothetical protein
MVAQTPAGDILPVDEIVEQFLFYYEIGIFVVILDQLTHRTQIGFPRSFPHTGYLQGLVHFGMPFGIVPPVLLHNSLLFDKMRKHECFPKESLQENVRG